VQLVQLQEAKARLQSLGYGVAALSYDSPTLLEEFALRKGLDYPLLADPESLWLASAGLLNKEATGMTKGTSLPATLVIGPEGTVKAIYRESAYQDRLTPASLADILAGGQAPSAVETSPSPKKPTVAQSQSDGKVTAGSLFTASVTLALPAGYHAYAPGAKDFIPVSLIFEPHPYLELVDLRLPESKVETLLGQPVPVYEGQVVVVAKLRVRSDQEIHARLADLTKHPLKADFSYQCCTESLCLTPETIPLEWKLEYLPLDVQRSPESLQHK
jgi:hypothetical protein